MSTDTTVGVFCIKNEIDTIEDVLNETDCDHIFVWDDGSTDGTWELVQSHPKVDFKVCRSEVDKSSYIWRKPYPGRVWLLDKIKKEFNYRKERVWNVAYDGDYYFLNSPKEFCNSEYDSCAGWVINMVRHRAEGWSEEIDTYPNWNIKELLTYGYFIERRPFAWVVTDKLNFHRFPWPRSRGIQNPISPNCISRDSVFCLHYGKRSPNYHLHQYKDKTPPCCGSKDRSSVIENCRYYSHWKCLPWKGPESIDYFIKVWNELHKGFVHSEELLEFYRNKEKELRESIK
jgi:glycosyltransferase involved in cell wall biosynthesis